MRSMRSCADRRRAVAAGAIVAALLAPARPGFAQSTARELYTRALAAERSLATGAGAREPAASAAATHRAIAAYESVVRRFPRSGYADDALWHAGQLAVDLARRDGRDADRARATTLLRWLVREYPASKYVRTARDEISRLAAPRSQPVRPAGPPAAAEPGTRPAERPPADQPATAARPASAPSVQPLWARAFWFPPVALAPSWPVDPLGTVGATAPPSTASNAPAAPKAAGTTPAVAVPPVAQPSASPPAPAPAKPGASGETPPAPPSPGGATSNSGGGFSLARQLGLGVSRIVIDPGHGGQDPGAISGGTSEAQLVLDIALRLEELIKKDPLLDVVLTRRADVFVPLEERTAIANRAGADLFVSIHANASRNPDARGVETYFLNFASNPDAEAVAARENATSGKTMASLPEIVRAITLNNKLDESRDLAGQTQRALVRRLRGAHPGLRDLGVKQAPFVVLIGATMPSVLVEASFLSNRAEGKLLRSPAYRQRIAESILDGLRRYRSTLKATRADAGE